MTHKFIPCCFHWNVMQLTNLLTKYFIRPLLYPRPYVGAGATTQSRRSLLLLTYTPSPTELDPPVRFSPLVMVCSCLVSLFYFLGDVRTCLPSRSSTLRLNHGQPGRGQILKAWLGVVTLANASRPCSLVF